MRKIEPGESAQLGLPTHEHHDLPPNEVILDTLAMNPGVWFHWAWEEIGAVGTNAVKLEALRGDASFRGWRLHEHIIPSYRDGGIFLMRDPLD